jgi:hypothetical protein
MSKFGTPSKTFALLTVAAIALAACGGSSENSSSESTAAIRTKNGIIGKIKDKVKDPIPSSTVAPTTTTTTTVAPTTTVRTDTRSCAQGGTCVVGDVGPGGGKVFYVEPATYFTSVGSACNTNCRYLEAARYGWSTATSSAGQTNCEGTGTATVDPKCAWSGVVARIGRTGLGIGHGYENTSVMIAQNGTAGYAATVARAYQGGNKTDWFLPSIFELIELRRSSIATLRNGFAEMSYWSSSETNFVTTQNAYLQDFYWPANETWVSQLNLAKTFKGYVRPVRAF